MHKRVQRQLWYVICRVYVSCLQILYLSFNITNQQRVSVCGCCYNFSTSAAIAANQSLLLQPTHCRCAFCQALKYLILAIQAVMFYCHWKKPFGKKMAVNWKSTEYYVFSEIMCPWKSILNCIQYSFNMGGSVNFHNEKPVSSARFISCSEEIKMLPWRNLGRW